MYKTTLTHLNCKSTIGMNWELHPIKKIVSDMEILSLTDLKVPSVI